MKERLMLTINYRNGNTIKQLVNYLHCENGKLYFTVDKAVSDGYVVDIPLENIASFDLETVQCDGWKVI